MIHKLTLLLLATSLMMRADDAATKLATRGIAEFAAAYQAWDGGRFGTAAEWFRQAGAKDPGASVHFYWQGAARFHRMLQLRGLAASAANTKAADAAMDEAVAALETALRLDATHAESHALLGTLYGMKINGSMARGLWFGPSVQEHQTQALQFGADNPRVRYLLGTGQFHTAKDAAARREALATLLAAERLFVAEARMPAAPLAPRWGQSSCRTFIGRSYEALGQHAEAAAYFRKALAEHPADHTAKDGLARVTLAK